MLTLLLLLAYMLPVLPVARRIHYVRTAPKRLGTVPARYITPEDYEKYEADQDSDDGFDPYRNCVVVTNGGYVEDTNLCNNCGGDHNYHYGYSSAYDYCNDWFPWDGKTMEWPEKVRYSAAKSKSIPFSIFLGMFWFYFVGQEVAKRTYLAIDPDWSKFAVEYKGAETKDQKIARLQSEVTAAEAKTSRIMASVDDVRTLEELDALVS